MAMIRLEADGVRAHVPKARLAYLRRRYREKHWISLRNFISPAFLSSLRPPLRERDFCPDVKAYRICPNVTRRDVLRDRRWCSLLTVLLNDRGLFELVRRITGDSRPIYAVDGFVSSMHPRKEHFVAWHTDPPCLPFPIRSCTLLINVGDAYEGGETEIRAAGSTELIARFSTSRPGDAALFRNTLPHRSAPVSGSRPKVMFQAWFSAAPMRLQPRMDASVRRIVAASPSLPGGSRGP